ncbi:MAG: glycosyltransferase [Betaproteobacteria bacterium]|nr:glycosyltransferase [Betaproteobacteria bacterium]
MRAPTAHPRSSASTLAKLPLTILTEPKRGKNRALNRALQEPLGELVVFTDDDILADPRWLVELQGCAARHPEADLFGGSIVPAWEQEPDAWIVDAIPGCVAFAVSDPSWSDGPIAPTRIWGANMMVRRKVFEQGLKFNDQVGPNKGLYIMGSETEFTVRVAKLGHGCWYCPGARVRHIIRANQLTRAWIMNRAVRFGRSERFRAVQTSAESAGQSWLFGRLNFPRWMLLDFARRYIKGHLRRLSGDRSAWANLLWEAHLRLGYMMQAQSERRARNQSSTPIAQK